MRAVLISIQPKWCELIESGKKTVEVRKTKPKLETPFRCYIYCTKDNSFAEKTLRGFDENGKAIYYKAHKGKVIGEFVCKRIDTIGKRGVNNNFDYCYLSLNVFGNDDVEVEITNIKNSCIPKPELNAYGASSGRLFAWHISDLVIYDEPRELGEFYSEGDCDCLNCKNCAWFDKGNGYNVEDDCAHRVSLPRQYDYNGKPAMVCLMRSESVKDDGYCDEGIRKTKKKNGE